MQNSHRTTCFSSGWRRGARFLACASLCFGATAAAISTARGAEQIQGIQNSTAPASNYDRFDNSSSFIGNPANWPGGPPVNVPSTPYVWSGVGRTVPTSNDYINGVNASGGYYDYWATMISPSFFVSAYHFHPATGDTVRFYYTNNAGGTSYEDETVTGGQAVEVAFPSAQGAQGDLWIGKLSTPVSSNVATYPILSLPFVSQYGDQSGGLGVETFGLSDTPDEVTYPYGTQATQRLGRNVINSGTAHYYNSSQVGVANVDHTKGGTVYEYSYDNPGVGPDESQVEVGDSGGPSFFLYGGSSPAILGVHWFEGSSDNVNINVSGDTLVPAYLASSTGLSGGLSYIQAVMNMLGNPNSETVRTESPILGDMNFDGHVDSSDITAMEQALTNLTGYETKFGLNGDYLKFVGDLNHDGVVNNIDLQSLLNILLGGGGSISQVPEPGSITLLGLGGLAVLFYVRRRRGLTAAA
ncbi:MAG TPA: dockerin type I repeat-containing protein [Pirellulales bacterium]|jgi:hypothetical protein|nr:dockerin type I repeat-containing protein [Pirellulales bacterium]